MHNARKFGNAHDAAIRNIGDPSAADDRCDVMFAMAFKRNAAKDNHLVIAIGFFKGLQQELLRILLIAGKVLLISASKTLRCFAQTVSIGVFPDPAKYLSKRLLYLGLRKHRFLRDGMSGRQVQSHDFIHRRAPDKAPSTRRPVTCFVQPLLDTMRWRRWITRKVGLN